MRSAGVTFVVVVIGCLALAASASARFLPIHVAEEAAEKSMDERSYELVEASPFSTDSKVDRCKRRAPGRVACRVHIHASEYEGLVEGTFDSVYRHKRCRWTVVSHFRGRSSTVYYFNKATTCEEWTSESRFE